MTLKLEGRLAGPYVEELKNMWCQLVPNLGNRKVAVDLRELTFADAAGTGLLGEIYANTGAGFLANTPLTRYFAEQATQHKKHKTKAANPA